MATNPTLLTQPIAANGAKNSIPNTTATPGKMSQDQGFPAETSLPLGAGGVAPSREDFNGVFNLLSAQNFMTQKGWVYTFDAGQAYYAGCIVRDTTDGALYECINDVAAGGSVPSLDGVNWQLFTTSGGGLYIRQSSTAYAVGDIAYNENLPSYMHLLCTTAGTTDSTEPDFTGAAIGGTVSDGTVVWTYSTDYDIERDYTIIYPNGGTKANPAFIDRNSTYIETNPFPGYVVRCQVEVEINGAWGVLSTSQYANSSYVGGGAICLQHDDGNLALITGSGHIIDGGGAEGTYCHVMFYSFTTNQSYPSGYSVDHLPCRVKVWKVGKVASA